MNLFIGKPPGVPCPPQNPHCKGLEPIGASIEINLLTTILIISGILLVLNALKIIKLWKI